MSENKNSKTKIFHIADLHLDSPFSGFDIKQSDERRAGLLSTFVEAIKKAEKEGCDLILIAGDLFDCGFVSPATVKTVFEALEKSPAKVVIAPGNHDPYTPGGVYGGNNIPKNVSVFKTEELSRIDFDELGISVHGSAFTSAYRTESPLQTAPELKSGNFNILCTHADTINQITKYAPLSKREIEASGFDYVALGHIHNPPEPVKIGHSVVAYPGMPEGRSFDELGYGGAYIVTADRDAGKISVERVTLASHRYMWERLDISGALSQSDVAKAVADLVGEKKYGAETSLRVTLYGAVSPDVPRELEIDKGDLSLLEIENETAPVFDSSYLETDITLRGALYRELSKKLSSTDPYERRVAAEALRIGLCALDGRPFM